MSTEVFMSIVFISLLIVAYCFWKAEMEENKDI